MRFYMRVRFLRLELIYVGRSATIKAFAHGTSAVCIQNLIMIIIIYKATDKVSDAHKRCIELVAIAYNR